MTHPKRTTKLTKKVRQAQLDFATPEIRLTKRARVAARLAISQVTQFELTELTAKTQFSQSVLEAAG
ncbi:hypothetical protein TUN199_12175, partial [Pyrenophora tritici-repentis]